MGCDGVPTAGPRVEPVGTLLAVDAATLYFRAFFGVPGTFRSPDGRPVNALRGYLDMTAAILDRFRPLAYAACWDADWRPAFRVAAVPSYKTHRLAGAAPADPRAAAGGVPEEEVPDDLATQVPLIAEALRLLGLARAEAAGFEADDVAATLATNWSAQGRGDVVVVSGDRDLFQLVDDAQQVRVAYIGKGVANLEVVDDAHLLRRYGVRSGRGYLDMAILRGDPSDGLPGVRGIGEKTAVDLVMRFDGLDGLVAAAADPASVMATGHRKRVLESVDEIAGARTAATAVRDAEVTVELAHGAGDTTTGGELDLLWIPPEPPDVAALAAFADRWGVRSSVNRVLASLAPGGAQEP